MAQTNQHRRVVNKSKGEILKELKIFSNEEFGSVRTIQQGGIIYFVGKDVAEALGYVNPTKAISMHCKGVSKMGIPTLNQYGKEVIQQANVIKEGDIYRLIIKSKLESAQRFEEWVFEEVLPQIRRTGGYIPIYKEETVEEMTLRLINILQETIKEQKGEIEESKILIEEKDKKIEAQEYFVDYARKVTKSDKVRSFQEVAKTLHNDGMPLGRNRLMEFLRIEKILQKKDNLPYQKYIDAGYFVVKHYNVNGRIRATTFATSKGEVFIAKKLNEKDYWKEWIKKK